jgi:UDP-glucose 4-epimerase
MDLAEGHVRAVEYGAGRKGVDVFNMGTGKPYSVLDMVNAFESVNRIPVPHVMGDRREGDLAECWAGVDKARRILGWSTRRSLEDMCRDTWNWQKNNPMGYKA